MTATPNRIAAIALLIALAFSLSMYHPAQPARAARADSAQIEVDTLLDSNALDYQACTDAPEDCSLRGAISKANADQYAYYTIILPAGTYTLTMAGNEDDNASGDLDIKSSLTLTGSGDTSATIDGNHLDRVFHIQSVGTDHINNVKITGGQATAGRDAGGILNNGSLTINDCDIRDNAAGAGISGGDGGNGGGIYNTGFLSITNSTIVANHAGNGGNGSDGSLGSSGGDGGNGGGIYNNGILTITAGLVDQNSSGLLGSGGTGWEYEDGSPGNPGAGGGAFNTGELTFISSTIENNQTGNGGAGYCGRYNCIAGGDGGNGGGIYNQGSLTLVKSIVENNSTGNGGIGGYGGESGGIGGWGGSGSGIYIESASSARLINSIIAGNLAGSGNGGSNGMGGCGGIFIHNSAAQFFYTTIARNTGVDGSGICVETSTLSMKNTILAGQTTGISAGAGSSVSMDGILWGSGDWANGKDTNGAGTIDTGTHSYQGDPAFVNPSQLDYHILATSAAIDKGVPVPDVTDDIDGQTRPNPNTGNPDLGADEYWLMIPVYLPVVANLSE